MALWELAISESDPGCPVGVLQDHYYLYMLELPEINSRAEY